MTTSSTTSVITSDNEWQRMTTSGNEITTSYNEWQQMTTSGKTNGNEWHNKSKRMRVILGFRTKNAMYNHNIFSNVFLKINVKQNTYRSSHRMCSIKKLLLKISQYSQENTWRPATLLKRDSNTGAFLWILRNF